ncbi:MULTISPECIES: sugar ABC transporter ATP-binding protein [unclassified Mesorhizobium]|uniref:sugar ABC transporter ATP-binding protein n=1 Tax=unclassified Mesorhizobium TaxID=325217 RepID=UPI0011288D02|nr:MULTISPECIES: sugar ABC transporter ATP-binding protein [unclassified Mesorhizobium]MBZ9896136.1 sugar ABC transporter ATP-binding protein [Mesorhizobium sp. BR1-1-6]TPJ53061.1 sugar ABC transporter ATP-binding protein [Mesorhizobium sp. B2-6-4]TPJ60223.1 sugar ABC transporter ATP-binding protein [Mesorhizobium sp. B2-6-1]TPK32282.1 sugar ABC transporter ATP-binding protein [Mesorhizobium sp. B2-5-3]TPK46467.1 sugar ABC transporter ATP-binding protein [Mesorhizobium sp. B2-5-2]
MVDSSKIPEPLLVARGVTRLFGNAYALSNASIALCRYEICGLLGANGAGKSTLSRIVCGHLPPSSGEILFKGAPLTVGSARDALRSGIALVAQETSLAPDMSVLENIFLPSYAMPGRLSFSQLRHRAQTILSELGHDHVLPLDIEVRRLSAAQRQLVEIAKALALNADLVIFDEPTASLSPIEVDRLFEIMGRLKNSGKALAFVSHRLEEVFAVTDRVTILREGKTVAESVPTAGLTQADVIRHMVGRDIGNVYRKAVSRVTTNEQPVALEVIGLKAPPFVRDVSFTVRRGEILGLGGLVGAGRSESAEAIFGLRHRSRGRVLVGGKEIAPNSPIAAIRAGLGMVAEDRRAQNIVPDMTVGENLFLAQMGKHRGFGRGHSARRKQASELISRLDLPTDRMDANLLHFSGGMQQKIIIARWLLIEPEVLILDEPTKGVDIGTRQAIYELLREVAERGIAVVVISSDFQELLGICERVVVVSDGYTIADLPASRLSEESLTLLAAPRSSAERNTAFLRDLVAGHGGTAFWGLIDDDRFVCLALAEGTPGATMGLAAGHVYLAQETAIPLALGRRQPGIVTENDGRSTLLAPLSNRRGHDLGWIGLSLPAGSRLPDAGALSARIAGLFDTPQDEKIDA